MSAPFGWSGGRRPTNPGGEPSPLMTSPCPHDRETAPPTAAQVERALDAAAASVAAAGDKLTRPRRRVLELLLVAGANGYARALGHGQTGQHQAQPARAAGDEHGAPREIIRTPAVAPNGSSQGGHAKAGGPKPGRSARSGFHALLYGNWAGKVALRFRLGRYPILPTPLKGPKKGGRKEGFSSLRPPIQS